MIKILKNRFNLIFLLILIFTMSGCIKENLDDCFAGLRLRFDFSLHSDMGNRFGPDVQVIKVYLFDEEGILRHTQEGRGNILTNDYVMNVNVVPGKYKIIAWGGSNEEFRNSFHEGHMYDPAHQLYENGVSIGKTMLNDFRVFLNYGIADNYPEDIIPTINEFDELYYGAVGVREKETSEYLFEPVEVKSGSITERNIELIRDTNILKVTIDGLQYFQKETSVYNRALSDPGAANRTSEVLSVWASAHNGHYKYDNSIGEYDRLLRYHPHYVQTDENSMLVDLKVMRLDMKRHSAEPIYLTIEDPVTGIRYPSQPIDIVNTLLQARNPETGDLIYKTQEDFDRIYLHPIKIEIGADLHIKIFVHNWEVVVLYPEIDFSS